MQTQTSSPKITLKQIFKNSQGPQSYKEGALIFLKGMSMGIADLIPGVSGGTIAFISGIYLPLMDAISIFDKKFLFEVLSPKTCLQALSKVHWRFLVCLGTGIVSSLFIFARVVSFLLQTFPVYTWSFFGGLIAASLFFLGKSLPEKTFAKVSTWPILILGTLLSYWIVGLVPLETSSHPLFLFFCGIIATMAMILPGISGSFLLMMLGKYHLILGALLNPFTVENFSSLTIFATGAILGLVTMAKALRWALTHFYSLTLLFLMGFLLGSFRKLWPWKEILESELIRGKLRVLREANIVPSFSEKFPEISLALVFFVFGAVLLLCLEFLNVSLQQKKSGGISSAG